MATLTIRGLTDPKLAQSILDATPAEPIETQRKAQYYVEPRWKRLTEYEILNCYSAPTPDWIAGGLDWGDWTQKFHGGRQSWGTETTELKTDSWLKHRDPARRWHAPYVKAKGEEWRYTERFLEGYSADGSIRLMDTFWRDTVIPQIFGAYGYAEYGLFNAHSSVMRDCLGDTIRNTFGMAALDKTDNAQMVQLVRTFISKLVPGYSDSTDRAKKEWTTGAYYKSARETVEDIWQGNYDWNEGLWGTHMVFDPLFGQYARREFFLRLAPAFGDTLTPFVVGQFQSYFHLTRAAMDDHFNYCLANDVKFGEHNRRWFQAWTDKYLPGTIKALTEFVGLYKTLPVIQGFTDPASVEASVQRVISDWVVDYANKYNYKVDQAALVATILAGTK